MKQKPAQFILPKALYKYKKARFVDQKRVQFTYYLLMGLIVGVILLILTSSYLHNLTPDIGKTFIPVISPMVGLLFFLFIILYLLLEGKFKVSAHLLILVSLISTWLVMIFDQNEALIRLDTIVLIFAILSMLPIMVQSNKYIILIYTLANLVVFLVFLWAVHPQLALTDAALGDYLVDVIIALVFLGFVNYNIFAINQSALDKADHDISEREKAENALFNSEKRYREMTDLLPVTVFETDWEGKFTYLNKNGLKKLGYRVMQEALGVDILSHVKNNPELEANLSRLKFENQLNQEQLKLHNLKGETFVATIHINKIIEAEELLGYRGIIIDITEEISRQQEIEQYKNKLEELVNVRTDELKEANNELKKTNADLDQQKQKLEKALADLKNTHEQLIQTEKMASLGILTAGVAHEINNPLNFIQGGYSGLKQYFQKNNNQEHEVQVFLNSIKTGIDRSAAIVSSLNQFSRQREKYDEWCNLHEIIDNCLLILNNQLKGYISIEKHYQAQTAKLLGNSGKLHQVFLNIFNNSRQAIPEEGTIFIKSESNEKEIKIEITDNGIGIRQEDLAKVADPFFTTKEPGEGTGLGLSISNAIINDHQGKLIINSDQGKGTTVMISLPLPQPGG